MKIDDRMRLPLTAIALFVLLVSTGLATAVRPDLYPNDYPALSIETIKEGKGDREAKNLDTVKVHYTGKLKDGTEFDSSRDGDPYQLTLGSQAVIVGWEEGLIGMKKGEVRRLLVPSSKAYGAAGQGSIPPNAGLDFEVELVDFVDGD